MRVSQYNICPFLNIWQSVFEVILLQEQRIPPFILSHNHNEDVAPFVKYLMLYFPFQFSGSHIKPRVILQSKLVPGWIYSVITNWSPR